MDLDALRAHAESFILDEPEKWFDLWHTHVDWKSEGNHDPEVRRACAQALVTMCARIREQLAGSGQYQAWLWFSGSDAGHDAVYVHSPNPHSEFPFDFDGVVWGVEPPEFFGGAVPVGGFEVGRGMNGDYYLRPAEYGSPERRGAPPPLTPQERP